MPNNDTPISSFQDATEINSADKLTGLQNNVNRNFSFSTILSWFVTTVAAAFVPVSRKVNNKALSADITLDSSDVGAQAAITASGILKGDGAGGVSAAVAGTDYQAPLTAGTDYATPAQLADKAAKTDLTSIQATGTTNTTGAVIPAGAYFYLNGVYHRAKTQIDINAAFTPGTNCEQATVGDALKFAIYTGTAEASAVPGTSYTVINRISPLPAGKYVIVGSASNGTNVNGTLALTITNTSASTNIATNRAQTNSGGGNTVCAIVELSAASTITLRATQTTGSSLSLNTNSLTAVKLV